MYNRDHFETVLQYRATASDPRRPLGASTSAVANVQIRFVTLCAKGKIHYRVVTRTYARNVIPNPDGYSNTHGPVALYTTAITPAQTYTC